MYRESRLGSSPSPMALRLTKRRCATSLLLALAAILVIWIGRNFSSALSSAEYDYLPKAAVRIEHKGRRPRDAGLHLDDNLLVNGSAVYIYKNRTTGKWGTLPVTSPILSVNFTVNLTELQEAFSSPWQPQPANLRRIQADLERCCSARRMAVLTQENTKPDQYIPSAFPNLTEYISPEYHRTFPKKSPFSEKRYGRCAVVGNGGILRDSKCSSEIDSADFVFRCNLPPLTVDKYTPWVGVKTNFTTAPMSMLKKYRHMDESEEDLERFVRDTMQYSGFLCIKRPSNYSTAGYKELQRRRGDSLAVLYENPQHFLAVTQYWMEHGIPRKATTGLYLVTTALTMCDHVDVYGFWPFPFGGWGQKIRYHYFYAAIFVAPYAHEMPSEFIKMVEMHRQGIMKVHIDKCGN
ncbi:PREDICTED: alpha-2,8-sialyltransferase 8E-like isoform X2 [Branchiostoma belcheri]|uniref:Alpha-2,8-sialyltransferase 8E-like isoform X1 n=2 Tax=Branchiostoma belcheri TaxID=7741 RepID=A0A6P4Z128_BRABE|nr:PREDICTED: alpha-2,8-sialyltransferase 8E-like isoform X1 [Branchiostoma belcheri]XP_019624758.1 PREDICTED: alpha-2,8-sialyltransferase 8E-like isoform X1 [Branchiostoma belcheri]XP_019624759.1 PREDICTED: alpha-2,8-sialyltransferase 8E-like isoform X2 [Branchiostoma belcheri]